MERGRNPLVRMALLAGGMMLIIASPVVGAIPGPGGVLVFAAGIVLVLQNSRSARRHFAKAKRRWPRFGTLADKALRRRARRLHRLERIERLRMEQESR